jgi:cysteinyl-tRNA synthetase
VNLQLRDSLSRSLRAVEPLDGERVRMYSCGPTVYRYAHVGNLRTFLLADLIRRAVLYHGIDVVHIQNITDVGHLRADDAGREVDPMLVAAGVEGRSSLEIADAYEAAFHADSAAMNILPAHEYPRATEHIPEMLSLAERLEDLGHAYLSAAGNLYYSVATYPAYGMLSGNTLDALRAGHRTEGEVEPDKQDPADFALWKAADASRELHWPSRWGEGFPGWHLECSAMALRHLGPTFDVHTGGEDNVFPHHEDEIAQSAPIVGGPPARLWVHGAHLLMSGRKMSKSAGNFQRITELVEAGLDPLAFRYLCLTARYARKLNLSDRSLVAASAGLASLRAELAALGPAPAEGPWMAPGVLRAGSSPDRPMGRAQGLVGHGDAGATAPALTDRAGARAAPLSPTGRALHDRFTAAIDADLDTPAALRIARQTLREAIPADERRWLVLDMDFVLGLDLHESVNVEALGGAGASGDAAETAELPVGAADLLEARAQVRAERDWPAADRLRDALRELGVDPIDRADGTSDWRRLP